VTYFGDEFDELPLPDLDYHDLIGADPDEEGLWDQLMLDLNDESPIA
jgi:hypothetical protein